MDFGKLRIKIRGLTPFLMNRLTAETLKPKGPSPTHIYVPEEEARKAAYITVVEGKEQLYIPNTWLYSMIVRAAGEYKRRGKRSSLSSTLAGTIRVEPEKILLGHCNYEIDERPVNIQRAKVLAWRPKIDPWAVEFNIIYNKLHVTSEVLDSLKAIIEDGGIRLGIGDYRPQHKGWFGTFSVEEFEVLT